MVISVVVGESGINQVVEQAWNERVERFLLGFEKLGFGFAHRSALWRVAIVCVVGDGNVVARCCEFIHERLRIKSSLLVINEVLQVVGIAAFLGQAEQDHSLGNEDPSLGGFSRRVAVDLNVAVVQCFDLRRENAPAVLRAHGEQTPPDIGTKSTGPKFKCPIPGQLCVSAPDCLLHGAGHPWEGISALSV